MTNGNMSAPTGVLRGWMIALATVGFALAVALGGHAAWAGPDADAFADVSDSPQTADAPDQAEGNQPDDAAVAEGEDGADEATDEPQPEGASDADEAATQFGGKFAKHEITVELGDSFLVGFAPKAIEGDSEDEVQLSWYKDWKSYVDDNNVATGSKSGWLAQKDADGAEVDYGSIVGIVTDDKAVFELFGEYPDYKVSEEGVEYRWWYGLLGKAGKAGDAKIKIVYAIKDGEDLVADECTVHVVESESGSAAAVSTQALDGEQEAGAQSGEAADQGESEQAQGASGATHANVGTAAANDPDSSQGGSGSSGLSSRSAANGGTGLSTQAADSQASASADSASPTRAATTGYPKQVTTTAQNSSIVATLLVNDAASEEAYLKLANNTQLSLAVEPQTAYATAAETSLSSIARTAGLDVAERLSVKLVNSDGAEVAVSGMNITVKMALDDTLKALDASSAQVWYLGDDGSSEKKEASIDSGFLTFATDHLSNYAVLGKKGTSSSAGASTTATGTTTTGTTTANGKTGLPQTGDTMGYLAVALAFVAGFSAASALNARRRMREKPFEFGK